MSNAKLGVFHPHFEKMVEKIERRSLAVQGALAYAEAYIGVGVLRTNLERSDWE